MSLELVNIGTLVHSPNIRKHVNFCIAVTRDAKAAEGLGSSKAVETIMKQKPCNQYTCFFSNYFSCDKSCHQQNGYGIWIIACKHNAFYSGFYVSLCVANQKFKACVLSSVNRDDVRRYSACNHFGLVK